MDIPTPPHIKHVNMEVYNMTTQGSMMIVKLAYHPRSYPQHCHQSPWVQEPRTESVVSLMAMEKKQKYLICTRHSLEQNLDAYFLPLSKNLIVPDP